MSFGKIFLCHASVDKGYVDFVAEKLGRTRIVYDKLSFLPGQDFRTEIEKHLSESSLFVFFASKASLTSYWCQFEIDSAQKLRMKGILSGALSIIIDHSVGFSELPQWMADLKSSRLPAPTVATRVIESALFAIAPPDQLKSYIVPSDLQSRLQAAAAEAPPDNPRIVILAGLEGIGRKAFLEFAARSIFGMQFGPILRVDETHALEDIYLLLMNETAFPEPASQLASDVAVFRQLPLDQQCIELSSRIKLLSEFNQFVCFVDNGGLLDEDGAYKPDFLSLFTSILKDASICFGVAHRRKPRADSLEDLQPYFYSFVGPMSVGDSQLLLSQLLRKKGAICDAATSRDIVEQVGGYPPAIQVTSNYIVEYGLDVLRNTMYVLTDFTTRRFMPFIQSLELSEDEWSVMHYLACERELSLEVIAIALALSMDAAAKSLRRLIDLNIVIHDDGRYSVAGPLRDSVIRLKGFLSPAVYTTICGRLATTFWPSDDATPAVDAIDATLHAALNGNVKQHSSQLAFVRASTVHRMALEAYYQKKFDQAESYARRVLDMDPTRWRAESLLIKALIQKEKYEAAEPHLTDVGRHSKKMECYLRGFMAKKRYRRAEAIRYFQDAIALGDDSLSVHRDLAECLYREGRIKDAVDRLEKVRARSRDNPFVLDLAVRIYMDAGNSEMAEACLKELQKCDAHGRFIHHREACLAAKNGDYRTALAAANRACELSSQPFEVFATRIDILIHLRNFFEAEQELHSLQKKFPNSKRDIVNGLWCKSFVHRDDWRKAWGYWEDIREKQTGMNQTLLRNLLEVKSRDVTIGVAERADASRELKAMEKTPLSEYFIVDPENDPEDT